MSAGTIKPHELANWLGVSPTTIRMWASTEFHRYLSPAAAGGGGRWRVFSEQDARILAYVQTLKQQGLQVPEIHAALGRMAAEGWRHLPEMPPAPPGVEPSRLIPEDAAEKIVLTQRAAANNQIAMLESRIDELKAELEAERERHEAERQRYEAGLAAERQRRETDLAAERQRREDETKDLLRQLVEAQTELRLLREGRLKAGD